MIISVVALSLSGTFIYRSISLSQTGSDQKADVLSMSTMLDTKTIRLDLDTSCQGKADSSSLTSLFDIN